MGDKVQSVIEKMVWDLRTMEQKGYFDPQEVKDILHLREDQEYAMNKFTSTPLDYLRAIDYEMKLEATRRQRYLDLEFKKVGPRDFSIVKRILFLFDRVTAKFRHNIPIWKQSLRFCIQAESRKNFYRTMSNALRFNGQNAELWEICASYELEIRKNPFKARKIFLQALRVNPKNLALWLGYLRFEIVFVRLVEQREELLTGESQKEEGLILDEDFVAFGEPEEGEEGANRLRDLLESSDEEDDEEEAKQASKHLERKKSNHELLLVIIESIEDSFGATFDLYVSILTLLQKEIRKSKSKELKLAKKALFKSIKGNKEISNIDLVRLVAINRGIHDENPDMSEEKIDKFVAQYEDNYTFQIFQIFSEILKKNSKNSKILDIMANNLIPRLKTSQELENLPLNTMLPIISNLYDLLPKNSKSQKILAEFLEKFKFDALTLKVYLDTVGQGISEAKRLKYLNSFFKNSAKGGSHKVSSLQKVKNWKSLVQQFVQILAHKIQVIQKKWKNIQSHTPLKTQAYDSDEESSEENLHPQKKSENSKSDFHSLISPLKIYISYLLKACHFHEALFSHAGSLLISEIFENSISKELKSSIIDLFAQKFGDLKQLCPANLFAYFLQNSSKFNTERHFDLALQSHPACPPLWKLRLQFCYDSGDLFKLQLLYNRGRMAVEDKESFMKMYQQLADASFSGQSDPQQEQLIINLINVASF